MKSIIIFIQEIFQLDSKLRILKTFYIFQKRYYGQWEDFKCFFSEEKFQIYGKEETAYYIPLKSYKNC